MIFVLCTKLKFSHIVRIMIFALCEKLKFSHIVRIMIFALCEKLKFKHIGFLCKNPKVQLLKAIQLIINYAISGQYVQGFLNCYPS